MLTLPRGGFKGRDEVRLATADWARPAEVARFPYAGGGGLFFGAVPYEDTWSRLWDLWQQAGATQARIARAPLYPIARARTLAQLESLWMSALVADCMPVGVDDDRHAVTIAGARSGKGQSGIVPNLSLYPGSVVCLDPKGENATLTAARRGQGDEWAQGLGQEVFVLDPFGVATVPDELRASLNPLALLSPDSPLVVDDAALLAEGLILPGGDDESHWTETARNLVRGVILYLVATKHGATLFDVRRYLTVGDTAGFAAAVKARKEAERRLADDPDLELNLEDILPERVRTAFVFLLWCMKQSDAFEGVIAGTAESLLGTGENERGSILSTARRNTAFLDTLGPRYRATLSGAFRPFDPDRLKSLKAGVTVYLCLPAERMGTHGRWLRLMIGLFLERMQRELTPPAAGVPVLFLLEEFFALGTMPAIEKAAGYAAGFGVKLWMILQDIQQLKSLYKTSWQTFLANAGVVQIFGVSDKDTLDYASHALGEIELSRVTRSRTINRAESESEGSDLARFGPAVGGDDLKRGVMVAGLRGLLSDKSRSVNESTGESENTALHVVPLLRPDEIALQFARESGTALLLIKGQRPMWILRVNYNESPWFQGLYTPFSRWQDQAAKGGKPRPFWDRQTQSLTAMVARFNNLATAP